MARASTPTLLSLERYSKIMGIVPPHFNQGLSGNLFSDSACSDVWYQWPWQSADSVAREDLALEIHTAEEEITMLVGYYPAPKYVVEDLYDYPRYHRPDLWQTDMSNVRGAPKSINLRKGRAHFIGPGRRTVTLIGTATTIGASLVYTDADGDGFVENARIVLPTTLTDVNEVKAYFPGFSGAPEWEIRTERSKVIAAGNLTMNFYVWQLVDPDLWEAFPPTGGLVPVDLTVLTNLLASAEVYREHRDTTQAGSEFLWNGDAGCVCGGTGCALCSYTTVDGCLYARDPVAGIVVPIPATYDAVSGTWGAATWFDCRDPDMVKLWYQAGDIDQRYLANQTHDPLSDRWARIIAYMATARLERPFCTCGNSHALAEWLREDLAFTPQGSGTRYTTQDILDSPFGSHRGEVMAAMQIKKLTERIMRGVTI